MDYEINENNSRSARFQRACPGDALFPQARWKRADRLLFSFIS
jgi:hypothetical protein